MASNTQIIELYTELAKNPNKDFGWDKGLENAKAHGYKQEWIEKIPSRVWEFCAAVGNPFEDAEINKGDTVLDLGCGGGVDILVASLLVGESGKVYGVDITPKMVETAMHHSKLMGVNNVIILESSFDSLELDDESVDVVISNGAINISSNKESVFAEIYRVLKPNGKIYFADMIDISIDEGSCCSLESSSCCASGEEDWANCVAGTMRENELIELIEKAGFKDVECTGHTHYTTAKTTQGAVFQATKIGSIILREKYWEGIFKTSDYQQVLWHQDSPEKSLKLIQEYSNINAKIIDVGCGASFLVDRLLAEGYKNITLLDTAKTSLDIVKERIICQNVTFVNSDILDYIPKEKYDVWHDRALFHFLRTKKEREVYFEVMINSLDAGAIIILSTFGMNGATQCAGLNIVQYDANKLIKEIPSTLELVGSQEYNHITPKGTTQKYIYFVLAKK